jgi:hypothetical protein
MRILACVETAGRMLAVTACVAWLGAPCAAAQGVAAPGATAPAVAKPAQSTVASAPAQSPAPVKPAPAAPAAGAPGPTSAPNPAQQPETYSYNPDGRRDPFVSLVSRGIQSSAGKGGAGLAGLTTGEIVVRGVLQTRGEYVAMIQGPDMKTYIVHPNDRLVDGTVRSIGPQGLVILQEVNDPLSLIKQREVRKSLRATDEGK